MQTTRCCSKVTYWTTNGNSSPCDTTPPASLVAYSGSPHSRGTVSSFVTMASRASRISGPMPNALARPTSRRIWTVTSGKRSTVYRSGRSEDSAMRSVLDEFGTHLLEEFPERFLLAQLTQDFPLV